MFNSNFKLTPSGSGAKTTKSQAKTSAFVNAGLKSSNTAYTTNGGVALKSTLNDLLDQFGKSTSFKTPRAYNDIAADMQLIYSQDRENSLKYLMYLRLVSRKVKLMDGSATENVQNGQGLRHEGIMRMLWLAINDQETFKRNIELFVNVGSFKDIITMMAYDVKSHGFEGRKLDWKFLGDFLMSALSNENVSELVKKYLPQIKSSSKQKTQDAIADTIIAKYLASVFFGGKEGDFSTYKKYRQLKSSGTAHQWQQLISKRLFDQINFNTVAGRALANMAGSKFLKNHDLEEKYSAWIDKQPVAKFTGYPYELTMSINHGLSMVTKKTINKQFETLVQLGIDGLAEGRNGFIGVSDVSGSMESPMIGTPKYRSMDIAKSMCLYLSEMNRSSYFKDAWITFSGNAEMHKFKGETIVDKFLNIGRTRAGSTNILAVADLFANIKKSGVSESEFPSGIVAFSDGEFDSTGQTKAFDAFRQTLLSSGFSKEYVNSFQIVLWDLPNTFFGNRYSRNTRPFATYGDESNNFLLSGLDPSVLKFIFGTEEQMRSNSVPKTAGELMYATLDQEILRLVRV